MAARSRPDLQKSLVGFVLGNQAYALPIDAVREIVNPLSVTQLPHAPSFVEGVADHRTVVLPVINLAGLLRVKRGPPEIAKWIIVEVEKTLMGFVVDAVTDVFGTAGREFINAPELDGAPGRPEVSGVIEHNKRLTFVLDVEGMRDWVRSVREAGLFGVSERVS